MRMWVLYIFISVIEIIALGKRLGAIFDFIDFCEKQESGCRRRRDYGFDKIGFGNRKRRRTFT